jgi:hypothetical protein
MAGNHLEDLIAEWYEFRGYFVRRNVLVGPRAAGGYECELDVVAFHPVLKHLVHLEPSLDADSWEKREHRFTKKFAAGRRYIPGLFEGIVLPSELEQHAVLAFVGQETRPTLGGGQLVPAATVLGEIIRGIAGRRLAKSAVPEQFPLLRTLQYVTEFKGTVLAALDT